MDDGRGIPLVDEVQKSSEMMSLIFGGHPLSSLDYANIEDFNNLELNMVNSLCESMSVCVWRNGKSYSQDYIQGIAQHELVIEDSSRHSGMKVTLKPNSDIFGNIFGGGSASPSASTRIGRIFCALRREYASSFVSAIISPLCRTLSDVMYT